jgi:WS/DGAT/MGAT family acyltransferase
VPGDRLTGLDAAFLHLEAGGAHMHVAAVITFDGDPPPYTDLLGHVESRLHLVPRYRQKLAFVPYGQGRPKWIDDPHFNLRYHVRHTALPRPGTETELKRLAGRLFAQPLDRAKPLWEIWLVEGLDKGRFALLSKTHHALVDGVSGVDIASVLFDASPDPEPPLGAHAAEGGGSAPPAWVARPEPSSSELLAEALLERATVPAEALRGLRALTRAPRQVAGRLVETAAAVGGLAWAGIKAAPPSRFNVDIGPHRRYTWVDADLGRFKAIKDALGGTLNDAVLAAVTLALGAFLRREGEDTEGLVLKAMVPVSVRVDAERGALGNRVAAMYASLPVGLTDPKEVFDAIHQEMGHLKSSGQAVGAQRLTEIADFAPTTIMTQAARLQARQRLFNLVVTNVPGPQVPLYLLGRPLAGLYPVVPLAQRQALGIAIMSYNGRLGFGLLGDYDAMPELDALGEDIERATDALAVVAGGKGSARKPARARKPRATTPAAT